MNLGIGLTDIDELVLTCRTERAREFIREAVASYRAGAYRSSIVSTWVAVTFDLIDKLRELETGGDAQATTELAAFDANLENIAKGDRSALPGALKFEREILDLVRSKFQLLDEHQFEDLSRLLTDRNRCAHPTFETGGASYQPSAELARTHIRNAIVHVLQQPPVQGKAAIQSIISQVKSSYFPKDVNLAKDLLAKQLHRPRSSLIIGLVDALIYGMLDTAANSLGEAGIVALQAMIELNREIAEPRTRLQLSKLITQLSDDKLSIVFYMMINLPEAWEELDGPQRDKFNQFMANASTDMIIIFMHKCLKKSQFKDVAMKRIANSSSKELSRFISLGIRSESVNRAVDLFANSGTWATANSNADNLVLPLIDYITVEHIGQIIRSPKERGSDLRSAGGMTRFVQAVRKKDLLKKEDLDKILTENNFEYLIEDPEEIGS